MKGDKLLRPALALVGAAPRALYAYLRDDPQTSRRIVKTSLALMAALGLTLPQELASILGEHPFLLGTIAIYLFPTKTVGGQLLGTLIGMAGILLGLAYAHLALLVAGHIETDDGVDGAADAHIPRRAFLWGALTVGALGCGYVRSRVGRSYLAINFFMLVNMFALIGGVDRVSALTSDLLGSMGLGAALSLAIGLAVWPEDRGGALRRDALAALAAARATVQSLRHAARQREVAIAGLRAAEAALAAGLHEANYELAVARVAPGALVRLHRCVGRLVGACRVFNASMRRAQRLRAQRPPGCAPLDINPARTARAFDAALDAALVLLDATALRLDRLYRGSAAPAAAAPATAEAVAAAAVAADPERFAHTISELCGIVELNCRTRAVADCRGLEDAAYTDQVNTTLLDVLAMVADMARAVAGVEASRRPRLVLPRKLRGRSGSGTGRGRDGPSPCFDAPAPPDQAYLLLFRDATTPTHRLCLWAAERLAALQRSRHAQYALKLAVVMGALALPAFVARWHAWYDSVRAQLAMISALVAMETTRGMAMRTAAMKLAGAALGAILALLVSALARGVPAMMVLSVPVSLLVGGLVTHATWAKAGTVCALAYNLILTVATVFPEQGPIGGIFARRLLTLPVGLLAATAVHLALFPYRARDELVKGLGASLDWLHHLLFAIEAADEHPSLPPKFDTMARTAAGHVAAARSLLPATHYELSLGGHWPHQRFERIIDKMADVVAIVVGHRPADPILAEHVRCHRGSLACHRSRARLLASLCNDLLVVSHTLSARLFLPRHDSVSSSVLRHHLLDLLAQAQQAQQQQQQQQQQQAQQQQPQQHQHQRHQPQDAQHHGSYDHVGRLADLVGEMSLLRREVDELTAETQCPKNGLLPHLSFAMRKSRPPTPATPTSSAGLSVVDFALAESELELPRRDDIV